MKHSSTIACSALFAALAGCSTDHAGMAPAADHAMGGPRMPGGCEAPAEANTGKLGCYYDASVKFGTLPASVFWHVDEFPDAASAAEAKGHASVVVRGYDRIFLHTVNGEAEWRAGGGRHLATVGPMPAPQGSPVTARFMQAMSQPGATTRPHRHDGAEAFYLLSGAICIETPDGDKTTVAGETYWVPARVPMQLTSAGAGLRRSLFLVLHASSQPWMTMAPDWTPAGACRR
jgi:quercetin dioxygenase-like cupin family protein